MILCVFDLTKDLDQSATTLFSIFHFLSRLSDPASFHSVLFAAFWCFPISRVTASQLSLSHLAGCEAPRLDGGVGYGLLLLSVCFRVLAYIRLCTASMPSPPCHGVVSAIHSSALTSSLNFK